MGLLEMGCPTDEYDSEIDDFVRLPARTDSLNPVTGQDVVAVWETWSSSGMSGTGPAGAAGLALRLTAVGNA